MFAPGRCRRSRLAGDSCALLDDLHELVDLGLIRWATDIDGELLVSLAVQSDQATETCASSVSAEPSLLRMMQTLHAAGEEDLYA
jgi:hypothetical protein